MQIKDSVSRTKLTQHYSNASDTNYDAEFLFPISDKACFEALEVKIGDRTIVGQIKEKSEAKEEYKTNLESGNTVAYAKITEQAQDVMRINLGSLLPGQKIAVSFTFIKELEVSLNKYWKLILPATLSPRYIPACRRSA